jgi:hypothetical protein
MIRAADRWCRVAISDLERHQLTLLRTELGLDPPPADPDHHKTNQHKDIAHDQQATDLQGAQDLTFWGADRCREPNGAAKLGSEHPRGHLSAGLLCQRKRRCFAL